MNPRLALDRHALAALCRRSHVRRLELFGSVLTSSFGPDSDVDVLVEFETDAEVGFVALARLQRELSTLVGRRVDVVPRAGLKPLIRRSVTESAETVYAA